MKSSAELLRFFLVLDFFCCTGGDCVFVSAPPEGDSRTSRRGDFRRYYERGSDAGRRFFLTIRVSMGNATVPQNIVQVTKKLGI
jgi:hypothetical protein